MKGSRTRPCPRFLSDSRQLRGHTWITKSTDRSPRATGFSASESKRSVTSTETSTTPARTPYPRATPCTSGTRTRGTKTSERGLRRLRGLWEDKPPSTAGNDLTVSVSTHHKLSTYGSRNSSARRDEPIQWL